MPDVFVYDTGALIAAENRSARMREVHAWALTLGGGCLVPGPVVTQAWRGGARSALMARFLLQCTVVEGWTPAAYRRAGELLGTAVLPPKKHPDAVDALVAVTAAYHRAKVVVTSDPEDIAAYTTALGIKPEIVRV